MSTESHEPQGPNVDEVLAAIESRGDTVGRLEFARYTSAMDVALTQAHAALNETCIYDGTADWSAMKTISDRVTEALLEAAICNRSLAAFVQGNKPTAGS